MLGGTVVKVPNWHIVVPSANGAPRPERSGPACPYVRGRAHVTLCNAAGTVEIDVADEDSGIAPGGRGELSRAAFFT